MRTRSLSTLTFSLLLLAFSAARLDAQSATLRGTYIHDAEASDSMDEIVDRGMERLGRIYNVWPISTQAKNRLRDTNQAYAWIQILPDGDRVTLNTDQWKLDLPANGTLEDWERGPGDFIDITTRTEGDRLEVAFEAEDGRRVNVYTLGENGATLNIDVTVTSPKLDSPLEYQLVYRRRD